MAASTFFLGAVAAFAEAFFGPVFFFVGAAGFAGPFVTRPDLVFPRTFSTSTTAGACCIVSQSLNLSLLWGSYSRRCFALSSGISFGLGSGSLLSGGSFLGCCGLGGGLFGCSRLLRGSSFCSRSLLEDTCQYPSDNDTSFRDHASRTLGAAGFAAAAGLEDDSFLASFTGPEEPIKMGQL